MSNSSQNFLFDLNQYPQDILSPNELIDLNQLPQDILSPIKLIDLNHYPENVSSPTHTNVSMPPPPPEDIHHSNKKKNLTSDQKRAIVQMLFQESQHGVIAKGVISKVANHFSISIRSVSRIWHDTKASIANGNVHDLSSKLVERVGRKRVQVDLEAMKSIPFRRRTNIRSLANALSLGKSIVHRRIKEGSLRPHSNPVKPYLLDDKKKARLEFCLSMIDEGTLESQQFFINMYDQIHIDEKWFYMSKTSNKYYLHPDEMEPYRTCKSKRFIAKIMFFATVARPRFDAISNKEFNGKVGIWPFVFKELAKRSSKNRLAGTLETKPILSVIKDVICSFLIEKLLPSIIEKWPFGSSSTIFIQQDNARPHIDANDVEFIEAVGRYGLDIRLCCQPPNSPDLNVLDLGFFRAIDSLQHKEAPSTVDEFVLAVENAFYMFPEEDLNNVFLTLQSCMVEILINFGGNNYKIPHMSKKKLIRNGQLPICIECDSQILNEAREAIREIQGTQE